MKIKSTLSTVLFYFFFILSLTGLAVVCSISDVSDGGWKYLVLIVLAWLVCILLAYVFYNIYNVKKHCFAIYCIFHLYYGVIFKKTSKKYQWLYQMALKAGSTCRFYVWMTKLYDSYYLRFGK